MKKFTSLELSTMGCGACISCLDAFGEEREIFPGLHVPLSSTLMVLCAICGNKRCPHAKDHENQCTNSNEPGQKGSAYEGACIVENSAVAIESNSVMRRMYEKRFQITWDAGSKESRRDFALGYASAVEFFFGIEHS